MSKKEKQETKTGKKKIKTWQIVTAVFAVILLASTLGKHRKTVHGSCSSRNTGNDRAGTEG